MTTLPSGPVAGLINGIRFRRRRAGYAHAGYSVDWFGQFTGTVSRDSLGQWWALDPFMEPVSPGTGFAPHFPTRRDAANALARRYGVRA